ncbi:MAG: hypothetical protein QGH45_05505 [Myxococcota bacterium]|jgi:hypothetical protein|nr:hypothetical protein [Myxococcota bacterium]
MRAEPYLLSLMLGLCMLPACKGDKGDDGGEKTESEVGEETATDETPTTPFTGVRTVLDGYEAVLQDPKGDVVGEAGAAFDLISTLAVASEDSLLIRITSAEPMTLSNATDVRLWLEQEGKMLTIEAKPDHAQRICELTPVGGLESEEIAGCLQLAQHFDIRIPGANLPDWLDRNKPYFISGVSTCCQDEPREKPYDEIDGAQEVWVN